MNERAARDPEKLLRVVRAAKVIAVAGGAPWVHYELWNELRDAIADLERDRYVVRVLRGWPIPDGRFETTAKVWDDDEQPPRLVSQWTSYGSDESAVDMAEGFALTMNNG